MASFFENQDLARRNTRVLVAMYALAVAGVIVAVDLVLAGYWVWSHDWPHAGPALTLGMRLRAVPSSVYAMGALGAALVIFAVSGWNILKLADGGKSVAELMGARRVAPGSADPLERRLVNVVEEMAIASGVRVPAVYVMDGEGGINAFAAGFEVSDAVITVTRGTLETLNRDELQGVIGHEFSHILHGDMRLNIRMIGVLAGIVFIGSIGAFLMRRAGDIDNRAVVPVFAGGLALFVVGYVGLFFARLIKAAVSRQREFLADASSVQYTRNPDGIAGALDQIGAGSASALVANRHAEDLSHMFFGQAIVVRLNSLFDTHPPVDERIERVNPHFQRAQYRRSRAQADAVEAGADDGKRRGAAAAVLAAGAAGFAGGAEGAGRRGADIGAAWGRSAQESARLVGAMDGAKVDYAARLLAGLPAGLRQHLADPQGARAALVALLLAPKDEVLAMQLDALAAAGNAALAARAKEVEPLTRRIGPALHLPVVDLALPAAKQCAAAERRELLAALETVIHADRRVSLHEFVVLTLVRSQLEPRERPSAAGNRRLADLQGPAAIVLSLVAYAGTRQDATGGREAGVRAAMQAGLTEMRLPEAPAAGSVTLEKAAASLDALKALAPMQKALLVKGLFAAATQDGSIRVVEAELIRLVGAVLDCPLPPLLEAVDPATLEA